MQVDAASVSDVQGADFLIGRNAIANHAAANLFGIPALNKATRKYVIMHANLTHKNSAIKGEVIAARPPFLLPFSKRAVRTRILYQASLVILDAILLGLSFLVAYWLRFNMGVGVANDVVPNPSSYAQLVLFLIPLWLLIFAFLRAYDYGRLLGGTEEYMAIANGCTWGVIGVIAVAFIDVNFSIARGWLLLSWVISIAFLSIGRLAMRRIAYRARQRGLFVSPALIVGTNREAASVAAQLENSQTSGMQILGFVTVDGNGPEAEQNSNQNLSVLGGVRDLGEIIKKTGAEEVIVSSASMSHDELFQVVSAVADKHNAKIFLTSGLYEVWAANMEITTRSSMPLIGVQRLRLTRTETIMKSLLDWAIILMALPLLLPLFGALWLAVRLDSPGDAFYRRRVLGVGGRAFDAFKFRTMYVNGNEILANNPELKQELENNHKLKNDPRITRVGAFLRRYSLDELPQLINVMLGQMSLVGPRMISPAEHNLYGPMRHHLLTVRPGLTGLWQVSGRSDLSYDERVQLDMYYVRNYSIWLDVQILFFQTIPAVLKGRGAY